MKRVPPSTIPLQNYGSQNMSPLTKLQNAPNYFDNQSYSLFGDPVPPPLQQDEYLENLDHLYGRFRHNSDASSLLEDFPKPDIFVHIQNEKPTPRMRLFSGNPNDNNDLYTVSGNPNLLDPHIGPDIRILPDSESGSDITGSPRYPAVTSRVANFSQHDISRLSHAEAEKRKIPDYSDDFKGSYGKFRKSDDITIKPVRIFSSEPDVKYIRNNSNESYSSNDWFKPSHDYEEFTKIPKLRPSSKNVLSINQQIQLDSPVATLLNDYAEYSSEGASDELVQPLQPQKLSTDDEQFNNNMGKEFNPMNQHSLSIQRLPPTGAQNIKRETSPVIVTNVIATGADYRISPPKSHKKPSFIIIAEKSLPLSRPQSANPLLNNRQQQHNHKENIHLGAGRVSPFLGRGFKDKSKLQPSQNLDPSLPAAHLKLPVISNRNSNPNIRNTSDESPRPSVQFDVSIDSRGSDASLQPLSKRNFQSKHLRRPISAIQPPISQNQKIRSFETLPKINGFPGGGFTTRTPSHKMRKSSVDLFQESRSASAIAIKSVQAKKNPTSREKGVLRVINSATSSPSRIPIHSKWTPDGLEDNVSTTKSTSSPLRNYRRRSTSPERRSSSQTEPRSSIGSIRRSSNLSSVTTSDFSFRRNSTSPMRRTSISPIGDTTNKHSLISPVKGTTSKNKSLVNDSKLIKRPRGDSSSTFQSLTVNKNTGYSTRKVAKATTLSPIIGTPNKDGPLTPEEIDISSRFGGSGDKRDNTKIPIRNGSNVTSRSESRVQSRAGSRAESRSNSQAPTAVNSRSNSPQKEYAPYSRPNSRAESKSSTRVSSRSNSRPQSLSRSRPISRVTSNFSAKSESTSDSKRPSRAKSRTNSRLDQNKNTPTKSKPHSKSNTPKSRKSPPKDRKKSSGSTSPKKTRRKSVSPTKQLDNLRSKSRGRSTSNNKKDISSKIPSPKKSQGINRNYTNRASSSNERVSAKKSSSGKSTALSSKSSPLKKTKDLKKEGSNLHRSSSNLKKDTSKKDKSPVKRTTSNIKRESSKLSIKNDNTNLKREHSTSNIKRESSKLSLKNDDTNIKREHSNIKQSGLSVEPNSEKALKREQSNLKLNTDKLKRVPSLLKLRRTDSDMSKKLVKKGSSKNLENMMKSDDTTDSTKIQEEDTSTTNTESSNTLIPLTKANVVSMTTAAITSQPIQITTALNNHMHITKTDSSGQLISGNLDTKTEDMSIPASILEKSQKTLENIQKTVTEATDEIHKTINENLTDLKTIESDFSKMVNDVPAPLKKSDSKKSLKEKSTTNNLANDKNKTNNNDDSSVPSSQPIEASVSVVQGNNLTDNHLDPNSSRKDTRNGGTSEGQNLAEDMAERVSERAISVLPYVDCEDANLQNYEQHQIDSENYGEDTLTIGRSGSPNNPDELMINDPSSEHMDENTPGGNNMRSDSQEYLDEEQATGCCGRSRCSKCCSRFCMPCRRCQGSKCCKKKTMEDMETASVIVKEVDEKPVNKGSCWKRMNCCKRKSTENIEENIQQQHMETINEEPSEISSATPKQNKCGMCLSKIFCCRATNKVEATSIDAEPVKKCCFCIPCKRKKSSPAIETAWQVPPPDEAISQRRESILSAPALPPESRCTRFMNKLKFWKKKDPSRRASMGSRKQSLAPTNPPEDTRPKLHNDLVDYNSKMKGAIPVLPIYLAYFCTGCNIIIPGLGTILSGIFCICVGIPRFSQYDSAKARFGSFVINCFVGVAQLFCVVFCFVGWGWSIWWGSIMMKTARKLQKIRKVEKLELEEEQRQAVLSAQAAAEKKAAETAGATTTKA